MKKRVSRIRSFAKLLDRPARHRREFADQTIGNLRGHRQPAISLEFDERVSGVRPLDTARPQLAIAEFGKRTLHRCDAARAACGKAALAMSDGDRRGWP